MSKNKWDFRDYKRDENGLPLLYPESSNDTSRYQNGNDTSHKKLPSTRDYNREIYIFVLESGGGVTRGDICKSLGLKKTPWLIAKIDALVAGGFLTRRNETYRNGFVVYLYEVNQ
jgi:hypothetical protein